MKMMRAIPLLTLLLSPLADARRVAQRGGRSDLGLGPLRSAEALEQNLLLRVEKGSGQVAGLADLVDLILPFLEQMEQHINGSHTDAQAALNNLTACFGSCTTAKGGSDTEASNLLDTKNAASTSHQQCRGKESTAKQEYDDCEPTMQSLEAAKVQLCKAHQDASGVAPNVQLVPVPNAGETYRSWLVRVRDWAIGKISDIDTKQSSCENSTAAFNNRRLECVGSDGEGGHKKVYLDTKAECNTNQTTLETTSCAWASKVEETCEAYGQCHGACSTQHDSQVANLQSQEASRQKEWWALHRIKCYLDVFKAANGSSVSQVSINSCQSADHGTAHLNLTYPTVPAPPSSCDPVAKPCSDDYKQAEYGSLPADAPAADCSACPSGGGGGGGGAGGSDFSGVVAAALGAAHSQCAFGATGVCHAARSSSFAGASYGNLWIKTNGELWVGGIMAHMFATGQDLPTDDDYRAGFVPEKMPIDGVVKVCGGNTYWIMLKNDGTLWGMGRNNEGQLGLSGWQEATKWDWVKAPSQMSSVADVVDVQCGASSVFFIKKDNTVWGVGNNQCLGGKSLTPKQITEGLGGVGTSPYTKATGCKQDRHCWPSEGPVAMSVNHHGVIFLRSDGILLGCGGNPSTMTGSQPVETAHPDARNVARKTATPEVVAGMQVGATIRYIYLLREGSVYASPYFTNVLLSDVAKMFVTAQAVFFMKTDGSIYGGSDDYWYLTGFGEARINEQVPAQLTTPAGRPDLLQPTDCAYFAGGSRHTTCITTDGRVFAAGYSGYGNIGSYRVTRNLGKDGQVRSFIPSRCKADDAANCNCFYNDGARLETYFTPMDAAGSNIDKSWFVRDKSTNPPKCTAGPTGPTFRVWG